MDILTDEKTSMNMDRVVDIHLSLPVSLLRDFDRAASARRLRRAQLLRQVIAEFLAAEERSRTTAEMRAYAEEMADRSSDFVRETDEHTTERLLRETQW